MSKRNSPERKTMLAQRRALQEGRTATALYKSDDTDANGTPIVTATYWELRSSQFKRRERARLKDIEDAKNNSGVKVEDGMLKITG